MRAEKKLKSSGTCLSAFNTEMDQQQTTKIQEKRIRQTEPSGGKI